MNESQVIPSSWSGWLDAERLFYLIAGCALLVFVWMGFQQFYLHGRNSTGGEVTRQIEPLVFVHGIAMSAWILFFLAQSTLIVSGNRRLHMTLGSVGAVLAALLVIVGISTALTSIHFNPDAYKDSWGARSFLTIPLTVIFSFGVLVTIGLKNRHRPEVHRPMMLPATLFVTSAALFRMQLTPILMTTTHGSMFYSMQSPDRVYKLALSNLFISSHQGKPLGSGRRADQSVCWIARVVIRKLHSKCCDRRCDGFYRYAALLHDAMNRGLCCPLPP